jgi:drug/metabolite transporter (DMT)-like permease
MFDVLDWFYLLGMAFVPALIALGLMVWKLNKAPVKLGGVLTTVVILIAMVVSITIFVGAYVVFGDVGAEAMEPWNTPLLILAALVGVGVGNLVASLVRKPQATTG